MTNRTNIIISGGGIAGLTSAILLADAGFTVALIDPAFPKPLNKTEPGGRTVALMNTSLSVLQDAGVWPSLKPHAGRLCIMNIIDVSLSDSVESTFYAQDIGQDEFGYNIPNSLVRAALFERVQNHKNIKCYEQTLARLETAGPIVTAFLDDNTCLTAGLIIGADGRKSTVRHLVGIKTDEKIYGQTAITGLVHHSRAHNDTSTEFHKPGGPLALVPLPGNTSSFVWVERMDRAEALQRLSKSDFEQALQAQSQNILGGLSLNGGLSSWPLQAIAAQSLIASRVALVAEAAHVLSPITAQGLNLSLRDVATLVAVVYESRQMGLDIGADHTLKQYERRRRVDMNTRILGVDIMNRVVGMDVDLIKKLRRTGLKVVDRIHPLKTWAMKCGLAPSLDHKRITMGE